MENKVRLQQLYELLKSASPEEIEIISKFAALSPKEREKLLEYWSKLVGQYYANQMIKDTYPGGKEQKVKKAEREKGEEKKSPSKDNTIQEYYANLVGEEYSQKLVEVPKKPNKGIVSTASKDKKKD